MGKPILLLKIIQIVNTLSVSLITVISVLALILLWGVYTSDSLVIDLKIGLVNYPLGPIIDGTYVD